jgi:hypothetical protein
MNGIRPGARVLYLGMKLWIDYIDRNGMIHASSNHREKFSFPAKMIQAII